ncbi:MAG: PQQ-dependent dehydrogenase, methanol/ethanol family [Betaproteobacteria bacterium]|nr:PQQ-dependent dehydrogenase, methanol/ethanol family [Betaproteobacteria bacterium]
MRLSLPKARWLPGLTLVLSCGAAASGADWPVHGHTPAEQRFSPLKRVNADNVERVGFAWQALLDSSRGLQATPVVVNGVMYVTSTWSRVFALDPRTGAIHWTFDPKVPKTWAMKGCCDVVNRGVAVADGRVFVGTYDGRLLALQARNGSVLWDVNTIDRSKPYTITGAPRVVGDKVVIGNGGADFGARGYFSAYDTTTGKMKWRFYTVPASANGPFEHVELEMAARTWDPNSRWDMGGGGTVWDSMSWDPDLNLLYVGTGNGSPWPAFQRSPAGGDNLFLSTILAINPDTGRLVWHYQTTPGDSWDYTATQHIVLADIQWLGKPRKVLFQAPKNGFFYVIDRKTGELLAADKYVRATWATHIDPATGRPVNSPTGDYRDAPRIVMPATLGGHNWHPMSYSPQTGLVYVPAQDAATHFSATQFNVLLGGTVADGFEEMVPDDSIGRALLLAWDPRARQVRWSVPHSTFSNAGVLSTAGGLVVQGDAEGYMNFYDAVTGQRLHRLATGTGIIAPPIAYEVDEEQYIAFLAGWGGALFTHAEPQVAARRFRNEGRVIALKLGGGTVPMPAAEPSVTPRPSGDRLRALNVQQSRGRDVYAINCGICHSWYGHNGLLPDLRRSTPAMIDQLEAVVLLGALEPLGMPSFAGQLSVEQVRDLKEYLRAVRIE